MADERNAKLILGIEVKDGSKAKGEIVSLGKTAKSLRSELASISRTTELDTLAKDMAKFAAETGDTEKALGKLNAQLAKMGASDDEIKSVARTFSDASKATGGGSGGSTPAAAKFRGAASLVGGGEIVGLIDDLQDLGEGFSQLASQSGGLGSALVNSLSPAMGSTAAGVAVAGAAFAGAGIALAALGAVIKAFTDEQAKAQAVIEGIVEAQQSVDEKINAGATKKALEEERELIRKNLEDRKDDLERFNKQYKEQFMGAGTDAEGFVDPLVQAFSGAEEGLSNSINNTSQDISDLQIQYDALTRGIESNETATADMKAAEEELAKQRDKEAQDILKQAQLAGQAVAAQKRALGATEEANLERLDSIEDEKAALQAQIDVLQVSGSTSEIVTEQIAQLNAQLGNLGSEADFINSTALAASRARDAEKKAAKDAEDAAKKAAQDAERNAERAAAAQDKYNDAIKSAAENLKQSTEDINTKLTQSLADNLTGLFRDVDDIAEKFRRDTFDADIKAQQAERDALTDHLRDIDDIREEGRKSERDAIQEGDFKQLFLARRATEENLRNEQKETQREASDRKRADQDARADLLRNAQRERGDRLLNYERQNADSRLAAQRELQQAQLARTRSLEAAANAYRAELAQLGQYLQARNQMQAQANQQALANQQQGISGQGISGQGISGQGISAPTSGFAVMMTRAIKK